MLVNLLLFLIFVTMLAYYLVPWGKNKLKKPDVKFLIIFWIKTFVGSLIFVAALYSIIHSLVY